MANIFYHSTTSIVGNVIFLTLLFIQLGIQNIGNIKTDFRLIAFLYATILQNSDLLVVVRYLEKRTRMTLAKVRLEIA